MDAGGVVNLEGMSGGFAVESILDGVALRILSATSGRPRTVRDLSVELNLPLASLYRKVHELQSAGALVAHPTRDAATGKSTRLYVSAIASLRVEFGPSPRVEVLFTASPPLPNTK